MKKEGKELDIVQLYKTRLEALRQERSPFLSDWRDIHDFLGPRTMRYPGEKINDATRKDSKIINTKPRFAVRTLGAGMQSGVTSPMRPWFRLGLADRELERFKPVKNWLYMVENMMRQIFAQSNIYDRLKSNYTTLGLYGTSALFVEESESDVIRAYDLPMGTFMVSTNAEGRVDTLYREVSMSTIQMMQKFGYEKCPSLVQGNYDRGDYELRYDVCHIVEPNRRYNPGSALSQSKSIASIWLDPLRNDAGALMRYKGYENNPGLCPRWDVMGEDSWGTGCGDIAIGDARGLQLLEKRKFQAIDKNVNPPMIADASLRNHRTSILPGDTTYVNGLITGKPGFAPAYQVNPYIAEMREEAMRIEEHIDEAFFKDLFRIVIDMADQPDITATQINAIREEKLMMLGPVLERLDDELLDPLIDITFGIMQRRGILPPAPEEIQGQPLRVEYISVLAQAQKAMGIGNLERFTNYVVSLAANTQSADPLDKLNTDELIEQYGDGVAVPPSVIRSNEEAQQLRDARSQQAASQQAAEGASVVADAAQKLSKSSLAGNNALTKALEIANVG